MQEEASALADFSAVRLSSASNGEHRRLGSDLRSSCAAGIHSHIKASGQLDTNRVYTIRAASAGVPHDL